ncbi:MAG: hypothetical protein ACPG4F_07960 [Paracoccaceae bacterium]
MNAQQLLNLKILPRLMMLASTFMAWNVVDWFMALGADATTQQTAFVSTVIGAFTGLFGIWMNGESK